MQLVYRLAADTIVVVHFTYVGFVIVGFLLTLIGVLAGWKWIRNLYFRAAHLLAILIVVAESLGGITCPLTTWESQLRTLAGQTAYEGDFIAEWVHDMLFVNAQPWAFTLCYTLFGLAVLATFILAPPRWRRRQA
jgi:hypothetical protein